MMPVDSAEFRHTMGHFASAVTVVTARLKDGQPAGITVTAFSSLSLDPPLVLVCIDKRSRMHDDLTAAEHFAVNILAEDQETVSRRFASSAPDQFREIGYREGTGGVPLVQDTIATIECRTVGRLPGGDHTIVVGQVEATSVRGGKPLVYFRGGYGRLA